MDIHCSTSINSNGTTIGFNQKITTTILALACCFFLSACASFSDGPIRYHKVKLTERNLSMLSGTYELYPDSVYKKNGKAGLQVNSSKYEKFHQYIGKSKIDFDTPANAHVVVQVSDHQVNFLFKEDSLVKDTVSLSYKLQSRGLLLLGNKYTKFEGIPYVLGGSRSEKTRIGLAKDGGLIMNHAVDNTGAVLLFFMAGYSYNASYHFKRINSK
ncbi:hypothetical protein [Pedobacter terrae]|uniref:hypothetical protein n=1 Tax=Pedobacter terrae TaxID=405671 RepID=UPI002FF6C4CA